MHKLLRNQFLVLTFSIVLITFCYLYLDQPIVFWAAEHHLREYVILNWFTHLASIVVGVVFLAYPILLVRLYYREYIYHDRAFLALANSVAIVVFFKEQFKFIFGRYWPATWMDNNPSLLRDNVYGFNWFHGGSLHQSFPSGHTAIITAAMVTLWIAYPRLRGFAILCIMLIAIGQIGLYYHFLSDVVAGGLLGYLVASSVATVAKIRISE